MSRELRAPTACVLPHDYVNFLLTGNDVTEYGDASGTALFDVRVRRWSRRICELIDPSLIDYLPSLVEPDKPAGRVNAAAAAHFGIPEGVLVAAGGGDNMMSAIGTGTVRDGFLTMSLGTSGTLYGYSSRPVVDPEGIWPPSAHRRAAGCRSSATMNCTVARARSARFLA